MRFYHRVLEPAGHTLIRVAVGLTFIYPHTQNATGVSPWMNGTYSREARTTQCHTRKGVGVYSAAASVYLGPEIPLSSLPFGEVIRYTLYFAGVLLVFGFLSEIAGLVSFFVMFAAAWAYKDYMFTYFNYVGEFTAFLFLGSRIFSLDKLIFGAKKIAEKFKEYESLILRVAYGVSVLYPVITVKLIHPRVIISSKLSSEMLL